MHRPGWTSVDQNTGAVYLTLSNDGGSASAVQHAANPRKPNRWGSVIRWYENGDDHAATAFTWDLLLLAGPGRDSATPSRRAATTRCWRPNPSVTDGQGRPELERFFTGGRGLGGDGRDRHP